MCHYITGKKNCVAYKSKPAAAPGRIPSIISEPCDNLSQLMFGLKVCCTGRMDSQSEGRTVNVNLIYCVEKAFFFNLKIVFISPAVSGTDGANRVFCYNAQINFLCT